MENKADTAFVTGLVAHFFNMSSKMKAFQRCLKTTPAGKNFNKDRKAAKQGLVNLSLKEQYLYHIKEEVNDKLPPIYPYEFTKKSRKQLVRDVKYLEKLAFRPTQLSKVVRHLPYLLAYNSSQDKIDERNPSISSKKKKRKNEMKIQIDDTLPFDDEDKNDVNKDEVDQFEYDLESYGTYQDPSDYGYWNEEDTRAVEEIRSWRLSFE